jgi:hypothetical protein
LGSNPKKLAVWHMNMRGWIAFWAPAYSYKWLTLLDENQKRGENAVVLG